MLNSEDYLNGEYPSTMRDKAAALVKTPPYALTMNRSITASYNWARHSSNWSENSTKIRVVERFYNAFPHMKELDEMAYNSIAKVIEPNATLTAEQQEAHADILEIRAARGEPPAHLVVKYQDPPAPKPKPRKPMTAEELERWEKSPLAKAIKAGLMSAK